MAFIRTFTLLFALLFTMTVQAAPDKLHPLFTLEEVYPANPVELKVSAMNFEGQDLYVTVMSPNRTNKAPFKKGEVYKITGLVGNSERNKIKAEKLFGDLYEPAAIAIHAGGIYVGEKDKISRFEDKDGDGKYEKTVLLDGTSAPNFHTYTVGFEKLNRGGNIFLTGNFTTAVRLGGAREYNKVVNPKVKRGSTFVLGPITGKETAKDVELSYIAGGYRTPNGIGLGEDQAVVMTDNQGIFNPANEFIRLEQGKFYGHYLMTDKPETGPAAFQPEDADSLIGGAHKQSPATVYMQQGQVSRSPTQPLMMKNLKGEFAAYNGQFLVGDVTLGRINRIFIEKVNGAWQGAVFLHSGGHDAKGKTGFTAGTNRIVEGPDGNYYLGHIGAGGLWEFQKSPTKLWWGLQRMSYKPKAPANFNEMVAVRNHPEGFEIEFFRPVDTGLLKTANFAIKQWTYIPTNGYGGRNFGEETLAVKQVKVLAGGKKALLVIDGIRDNRPPYITRLGYTNQNVGWVVNLKAKDSLGKALWNTDAWYTVHNHQGPAATKPIPEGAKMPEKQLAQRLYKSTCSHCHALEGKQIAGPNLKSILGRKQTVMRGGKEVEVTIDKAYLELALTKPYAEYRKGLQPSMPVVNLNKYELGAMVKWLMDDSWKVNPKKKKKKKRRE